MVTMFNASNNCFLKNSSLVFSLVFILLISGCQSEVPVSNPYYKDVFDKAEARPPAEGLMYLDSVKNILFKQQPPGADDKARYYRARVSVMRNINLRSCLLVLDTLKTFLQQHRNLPYYKRYYAQVLTTQADIYTNIRRYEEGLKALTDAKQFIDENLKDSCISGEFSQSLGNMLFQQGRYHLAASYFMELYRGARFCDGASFDSYYYRYSGLTNAGFSYHENAMYDSARNCFEGALDLIKENEPRFPEKASYFNLCRGVVSRHLGYTKMALKQFDDAERLMLFAIEATQNEYASFALSARLELAELYVTSSQLPKAREVLDGLDTLNLENGSSYIYQASINKHKKNYYQKKGDYATALYYNDIANAFKDSQNVIDKKNIDRDFALEIEASQQKIINNQLKLENDRTSSHLQVAILLVVVAVLVIALIWSNLSRTARHARTLDRLNTEIQVQKQDVVDAYISLEKTYTEHQSLLRTVAHDLKNPLAAIASLVRTLSIKIPETEVKETLELINTSCKNSIVLINGMVVNDEGKLQHIKREKHDMLRILEYCIELMKPKAEEKKQQLLLEGEVAEAYINKDTMWRVIVNIINNAIKFSPEESSIHVTLEKVEHSVVLSVKDQGIGIPEHLQEKVFESSPEARRTGTSGEQSFGLGLAISKKIVEEHNGKVWVESEAGVGSTFFVMLPSGS